MSVNFGWGSIYSTVILHLTFLYWKTFHFYMSPFWNSQNQFSWNMTWEMPQSRSSRLHSHQEKSFFSNCFSFLHLSYFDSKVNIVLETKYNNCLRFCEELSKHHPKFNFQGNHLLNHVLNHSLQKKIGRIRRIVHFIITCIILLRRIEQIVIGHLGWIVKENNGVLLSFALK